MNEREKFILVASIVVALFLAFVVTSVHIVTTMGNAQKVCSLEKKIARPTRDGIICVKEEY